MKGITARLALVGVCMLLTTLPVRPQAVVVNPLEAIQVAKEIIDELKHFGAAVQQFGKEVKQILQRAQQASLEEAAGTLRNDIFEKIRVVEVQYIGTLDLLRRRLEKDYSWDALKLGVIDDILNTAMFRNIGQGDPYQGLFTGGSSVQGVFSDVAYRDNIYNSSQYKNDAAFRQFFDEWVKEEERMLQDMDQRKAMLANVSQMQVLSEGQLQKFQKSVIDFSQMIGQANTQETKYANFPSFLSWNIEMHLELARENLQQILVRKTRIEAGILMKIRRMYQEKLDALCEAVEVSGASGSESAAVKAALKVGK